MPENENMTNQEAFKILLLTFDHSLQNIMYCLLDERALEMSLNCYLQYHRQTTLL